jgi:flagellar basal-body rod protein FlgG
VGSSSAEYDLWCDVLQGLSEEQAAGVLQMWKQGRAQGVTRPPVDHAAPDAGTETSPLPGAATLAPVPTPLQVAGPRPIRLAVPEHESPAAVEAAAAIRAIHAHNLANQQTWGFKRWIPEYQELLIPGETGAWQSGLLAPGAGFTGIRLDMSAGRLIGTGQPLDAAILGDGFFVLKLDNQPVLSRCGSFRLSPERRLALELGTDRWAIVQPEWTVSGEGELTLTEDGRLLQAASSDMAPVEIGRLQLATVPRTASLTPLGGGLFAANARSGEPVQFDLAESEAPGLAVGSLEASNVDADVELERLRWLQECLRLGTQLSARPAGPRAAQVSSESGE